MTLCAKCHKRNATRQLWCLPCYARPTKDGEGWDRLTVGSSTGWAGGRATGEQDTDESEVFDPRDGEVGEQHD